MSERNHDLMLYVLFLFLCCLWSSAQVSGKVAGGALRLPHVQQTHSRPPWAAPQYRDSFGWTGVTSQLVPAWVGWWRPGQTSWYKLTTNRRGTLLCCYTVGVTWSPPGERVWRMPLHSNHLRDGNTSPWGVWEIISSHSHITPPLFFQDPPLHPLRHIFSCCLQSG